MGLMAGRSSGIRPGPSRVRPCPGGRGRWPVGRLAPVDRRWRDPRRAEGPWPDLLWPDLLWVDSRLVDSRLVDSRWVDPQWVEPRRVDLPWVGL